MCARAEVCARGVAHLAARAQLVDELRPLCGQQRDSSCRRLAHGAQLARLTDLHILERTHVEVRLSLGLDDFISPSAACVKPVKLQKKPVSGRSRAVLQLEGVAGRPEAEGGDAWRRPLDYPPVHGRTAVRARCPRRR